MNVCLLSFVIMPIQLTGSTFSLSVAYESHL